MLKQSLRIAFECVCIFIVNCLFIIFSVHSFLLVASKIVERNSDKLNSNHVKLLVSGVIEDVMRGQCNLHRTKRLICGGCGYSDIKDLPTSNEAGRSLGKSL